MKKSRNKNLCRWRLSNTQPHPTTLKSKICKECWNHPVAVLIRDLKSPIKTLNAARSKRGRPDTIARNRAKPKKVA